MQVQLEGMVAGGHISTMEGVTPLAVAGEAVAVAPTTSSSDPPSFSLLQLP